MGISVKLENLSSKHRFTSMYHKGLAKSLGRQRLFPGCSIIGCRMLCAAHSLLPSIERPIRVQPFRSFTSVLVAHLSDAWCAAARRQRRADGGSGGSRCLLCRLLQHDSQLPPPITSSSFALAVHHVSAVTGSPAPSTSASFSSPSFSGEEE